MVLLLWRYALMLFAPMAFTCPMPPASWSEGQRYLNGGQVEAAIAQFNRAAAIPHLEPDCRALVVMAKANALRQIGQTARAYELTAALLNAQGASLSSWSVANLYLLLGHAHWELANPSAARTAYEAALARAQGVDDPALQSAVLINLGNVSIGQRQLAAALELYGRALASAQANDLPLAAARAALNAARAGMASDLSGSRQRLAVAAEQLQRSADSPDKAFLLVSLGELALRWSELAPSPDEGQRLAYRALAQAVELAQGYRHQQQLIASYAWGALGTLYQRQGRDEEALLLTRRALALIQGLAAPTDAHARWLSQLGELHRARYRRAKANGDLAAARSAYEAAVTAYRSAVEAIEEIQQIRSLLLRRYDGSTVSFRQREGRAYIDLVDLYLDPPALSLALAPNQCTRQPTALDPDNLRQAQRVLETFKQAELEDFFQDDCVDRYRARLQPLDQAPIANTATVYPIVLPDRLELIVQRDPTTLQHWRCQVSADTLATSVDRLARTARLTNTHNFYRRFARELHQWLVAPYADALKTAGVETLVVIPDTPLHRLPFAALTDGERFVIEDFALAISPSLTLTDLQPLGDEPLQMIVGALSDPVVLATESGPPLTFSELNNVEAEVESLYKLLQSTQQRSPTVLLNRRFRNAALQEALTANSYNIVHLATHGVFASEVEQSFLLSYGASELTGERLPVDLLGDLMALGQAHNEPIELLTLSACETARGDDKAALGLAGLAVRSGARSALATLWQVNDAATAELMADFYRRLLTSSASKAQALRQAQLALLGEGRERHPYYWAPFILIGNWL